MEKLIWHNETRKVSDLIPYDKNPRKMTEEQVIQLRTSLEKFNLVEVPAIDIDNTIVAGHQRLKVLSLLGRGEETIDVRVPNRKLTQEEFEEYLVRSNKNTGDWDFDMLGNLFNTDQLMEWGFSPNELGIDTKNEIDTDSINTSLDSYLESNIKQIVLYFKDEEYKPVLDRLEAMVAKEGLKDYSEALLLLLDKYENTGTQE